MVVHDARLLGELATSRFVERLILLDEPAGKSELPRERVVLAFYEQDVFVSEEHDVDGESHSSIHSARAFIACAKKPEN